ncbi:MAG: hypothetical protein EXQ64_01495 [Ilumatobacteraceae bacterium]|nr:hypothetical protein [Ilumatobacteraceae bacterium]
MFNRSKKETRDALVALSREIEQLRTDIQQQIDLVARERQSALEFAERLTMIEGKVSGMGAELSRQLHELGNDIESLSQRPEDALTAESLTLLRNSQVRLANEQARYEIAFRQDLAALAEQLRRPH